MERQALRCPPRGVHHTDSIVEKMIAKKENAAEESGGKGDVERIETTAAADSQVMKGAFRRHQQILKLVMRSQLAYSE